MQRFLEWMRMERAYMDLSPYLQSSGTAAVAEILR